MIDTLITDTIIIGSLIILAAVLTAVACHLMRDRDDGGTKFNWDGTVPAAPGQCSCGAPHARALAPFPPETAPALPEMIAAPVAAPPALPDYVTDAMGHGGDSEAAVASIWDRIQVDALNEKLREDAP